MAYRSVTQDTPPAQIVRPKMAPWSPLALFNGLAPRDPGARRVARHIAYGPHPRQRLDLFAPLDAEHPPLLVFFYGGSWEAGSKDVYAWAGQALAAQGFLVAIADYRLVPEAHFPDFVEDGASAVACAAGLASAHGGDGERILLAGHSAGAHIAAMLALDTRFLERAGVAPRRVRAMAGLAGPYDFHPFDVPASINAFGRAPDPLATQPVSFAHADAPALWLASGDGDTVVRPRNSLALADRVNQSGGRAEVRLYPKLDHAAILLCLSRPFRRRAPVLSDMAAFLKRSAAGSQA